MRRRWLPPPHHIDEVFDRNGCRWEPSGYGVSRCWDSMDHEGDSVTTDELIRDQGPLEWEGSPPLLGEARKAKALEAANWGQAVAILALIISILALWRSW